jgi:hypothetical protein
VYVSSVVLLASMYSTKCLYLVSLSVITRIELYLTLVIGSFERGSLTMKSRAMDFYTPSSVGGNFSSL